MYAQGLTSIQYLGVMQMEPHVTKVHRPFFQISEQHFWMHPNTLPFHSSKINFSAHIQYQTLSFGLGQLVNLTTYQPGPETVHFTWYLEPTSMQAVCTSHVYGLVLILGCIIQCYHQIIIQRSSRALSSWINMCNARTNTATNIHA